MANERRRAQLLEAYERNQPALTIELARQYLATEPDDRSALLVFGEALTEVARYAEARAALERALALSQSDERLSALRLLGRLSDAQGRIGEAEEYYRAVIAAAPDHASAYVYLGAMLARAGRLEEAEQAHRQGIGCKDGAIGESYFNLALVQRARGDYVGALGSLRSALALDPEDSASQDALLDVEAVLFKFPAG